MITASHSKTIAQLFAVFCLSFLPSLTAQAAEASEINWACYGLIIPKMGEIVHEADPLPFSAEVRSEYQIYKLSENENQVYRFMSKVRPDDTKIVKLFTQDRALQNDVLAFEVIEAANAGTFINVIERKVTGPKSLELKDIRGRTLTEVLNDKTIDAQARAILLARYQNFLDVQVKNLTSRFGNKLKIARSYQNFWSVHILIEDYPEVGQTLKVFLRSDNILVESKTANLYLIDPY